ncbi:MAG: hypothetical protein KDA64_13885, partial [Rhodospirillaceae bacterium]|nr:hypothetical protein [Rhodospirillaceae bacterium]
MQDAGRDLFSRPATRCAATIGGNRMENPARRYDCLRHLWRYGRTLCSAIRDRKRAVQKMFGRATLAALGLALGCAVWTVTWAAAWAQVEPVNVLQRVDAMGDQVALLRLADGLDGDLPRVAADHPRMPRHVLQQARNVYQRIAALRWLNGLETDDLVPVPPREIEPADVLAVVDQARAALSGLAPVYGVPVVGELPDRRTQAAPANVMAELRSLSAGLSDLGVPDIVPNDVYRIALALSRHAEGLALARGI